MKCHPIWIIPLLFALTQSISQKCQPPASPEAAFSLCPINSFCNQNDYCQCSPGWVLSCTTPSTLLSEQKIDVSLSQQPIYFTIIPQTIDSIYVYRFQICTIDNKDSVRLQLSLFVDEGKQTQLNSSNFIGQQWLATKSSECWPLFSPYMEFGSQENGLSQQMILKVSTFGNLRKNSSNLKQQIINNQKVKLKLSVMEIFVLKTTTIWAIIILFMFVLFLSFLGAIIFCLRAIRRDRLSPHQPNLFTDNNLDHFNELLPITKLSSSDTRIAQTCSICLLDFQANDQIRSTSCGHIFHYDCLDIWCKKNLNCPVCRNSLQKGKLQAKKNLQINLSQVVTDRRYFTTESNEEGIADAVSSPQSTSNMRKKLINGK